MNFEQKIRQVARKTLPRAVRVPLGRLAGHFKSRVVYPFLGLLFDLKGGKFTADGCTFMVPRNITTYEFRACFFLGNHEADERVLLKKYVRPEDSVLELGACLGVVSCITNRILREKRRHVVVEANPYCLPAIHRNRSLNQAEFLVENCAASKQQELNFYVNPTHITGSTAQVVSAVSVRVPGRSIKDLSERYGPFSVLIMDIEGGELENFEAAGEVLKQFRLVIVELHETVIGVAGVTRCRDILGAAGFRKADESLITEVWQRN